MSKLTEIDRKYGKGSLIKMTEQPDVRVGAIPTGAITLDKALGIGGLPLGRVVEIFGPESSGKTTLALHVVAEAQKLGAVCAYVDVENALDPVYAEAIGVQLDKLYVAQPDSGEQALNMAIDIAETMEVGVIVIDSVAALVPRAEVEGDVGDSHVGLQARMMGQALRKLSPKLAETNTLCIFINQLREKIGVLYGSPEVTPGGRALKFYASVRLDIRARERIKQGDEVLGCKTEVKVVKNKVAIPHKKATFDITYGQGISREGSIVDLGITQGVIDKNGAWLNYGDTKLGQGRENAKQFLIDNTDVRDEISKRLLDE